MKLLGAGIELVQEILVGGGGGGIVGIKAAKIGPLKVIERELIEG